MVIEPRKVATGWLLRWPKEAFQLMSRAWILWMGTAALLAGVSQLLVGWGLFRLLFWPLGMFVMVWSTGFARLSDHKFVTARDIWDNSQTSFMFTVSDLYRRRIVVLGVLAIALVLRYLGVFDHVEGVNLATASEKIAPSNLLAWLLSPNSPLRDAGTAMCAGVIFSAAGILFPGMSGCLRQTFGNMDRGVLAPLVERAAQRNLLPFLTMGAFNFALPFASGYIPVLGWLMGVFLPVLSYVASREIFVDGNGNRKRAPRTSSSRASGSVAGAA